MFFKLKYSDEVKNFEGLANICAQSSQYQGKEYPCANIDMQDRLISLVNAGIPDGKNELELKNNGFKSGRVYKLIQKEQQQLLNVVINEKGPKRGRELRVLSTKKEIDHILYKALQPLKVGGKILGALRVWLLLDNDNWDVSQVRCNSVINLANKHVSWNPGKTDNDDVRLSDSANEEVKDPDEEDQETREQLYQDLDAELTPNFIKRKLWKKKTETSTQYKNFQFYCIKQEYTRRHKEIIKYQKELEILISHLKNNLQQTDFQQLQQFLHEKTKKVKVLTIEIHERKLQKLNKGPIGQNYETLKHKIIHNYSSYNLLPEEERLLCRGWDFCIENKISNFIDFKTDIEINTTKLEQHCHPSVFKNICRKIYNHSDKLITSIKKKNIRNISDEEFIALKKLKNNQDIIISKADKGNAIVILDKKDYIEKIHEILKLKQFITSHESSLIRKEKAMNAYLSSLKKEKLIEKALFYQLHSTSSSLAVLYGQPKIHKLNYPLRPIISSVGAYNYELSKYLSNIIKNNRPTKSMSYIKDSFEFVKEIKNITNSNYQTMVSFDIENLYTNIPVHEAIEETLDILFKKEKNKGATIIPFNRTQFKKLLEFAVCEVPFRFLNNTYIQQDGVAMGSPLAPILADIFISKLELKLNKFSINKPLIWKRYVDDVFCIFHNSQKISKFLISINKWHKNIKFTLQNEEDDEIAFLDVLIIRDKTNNKYTTTLYKKPTNTNLYMLYESNQSRQYKIGLIRTLVIRILLICSTISHQETELNTLKTTLIHNGYPMHLIKRGIREANCIVNKMNNKKELTQQPPTKKKIYFILPYYDGNGSGLQLNDSNDKLANTTNEENFDTQSREVQFGNEFDLNRENVLVFEYGTVELDMLNSKFSNIYFDCSPYHIINRELQQVIQQVDIKRIIPESSAPHLQIPERPNIWESHPIFVGRVYQLIAELFDIPLRQAPNQLLKKL
ncbi:unnamed protein product [Rotaria socialis]